MDLESETSSSAVAVESAAAAEAYVPGVDESGTYVDRVSSLPTVGIRCPCGARTDKVYHTPMQLRAHFKTQCHREWIDGLNADKDNALRQNKDLGELVRAQKQSIARLEREVKLKSFAIEALSRQLAEVSSARAAKCGAGASAAACDDDLMMY